MPSPSPENAFRVPLTRHLLESAVHAFPRLWTRLGGVESRFLESQLAKTEIDRPVYVAGVARSGSTILLEALASHRAAATHQYRDFQGIFTPYWWHAYLQHVPTQPAKPCERAHGDGLMITPQSPEAMEEAIWMAFFCDAHNPTVSQVLDQRTENAKFETFYTDHLKKLLNLRDATRYVSKGNYNVTRLQYLLKLFPDARIVIPVRNPLNHIASLMKQHRLFRTGEAANPRATVQLARVGHYEFGLNRRAINPNNDAVTKEVTRLWERGEEVRGWALYWSSIYGWLADQLDNDDVLRRAAKVVRYEDLCESPHPELARLFEHTELDGADIIAEFSNRIAAPQYYRPDFSPQDEAIIAAETASVAARFGYGDGTESDSNRAAAVATPVSESSA